MTANKRFAWGAAASLVAGIALCLPMLWRPFTSMPDDSYFYLQVARNIHRGAGSTFHGITPTNGYHPLWLLFCVAGFFLGGGERLAATRWTIGMQQAMAGGAVFLFYRTARALGLRYALPAAGVLLVYLFTGMFGSEAHLNALLTTTTFYLAVRTLRQPAAKGAVFETLTGWSAGWCVLARLDNVFVAGSILTVTWLGRTRRSERAVDILNSGLRFALPAVIPVAAYMALNQLLFGHALPISGAIKSTFPHPVWNPAAISLLGRVVCVSAMAAMGFATYYSRRRPELARAAWMLAPGVLLHAGYVATMTSGFTLWSWYYVPGVILFALTLALAAEAGSGIPRKHHWHKALRAMAPAAALGLLLIAISRAWIKSVNPDAIDYRNPLLIQPRVADRSWEMEMAFWLRDHLPREARVAMWDLPGVCAFMTDLSILPADGLMNDYTYNRDLLREGTAGYLARRNVTYWVGPLLETRGFRARPDAWSVRRDDQGHHLELFAPLYRGRGAGEILLADRNLLADLREHLSHPYTPPIGVWRIRP